MTLKCRFGFYDWSLPQRETHKVQLQRIVNAEDDPSEFIAKMLGYEYRLCTGPSWRRCLRDNCLALMICESAHQHEW